MAETQKNRRTFLYVLAGIIVLIAIVALISFLLPSAIDGNCISDSSVTGGQQSSQKDPADLTMPLFRITNSANDSVSYENSSAYMQLKPAPSAEECPSLAGKALEPYGGIPQDANLESVQSTSNACIGTDCFLVSQVVKYRQKPYDIPIHGDGGRLNLELTAGGIPSEIYKHWLTLNEVGVTHIIPASEAINRLRTGEGKNIPLDPLDLTIASAQPGYYSPENVTNGSYLEPIWIITARDEIQGRALTLYVSAENNPARHEFSDIQASGVAPNFSRAGGKIPQPDISTASHVLVGTSGPVEEDAARESIRKFTANSSIALDYHGQSSKKQEGCGGQNYNWVFYDFTSGSCEFYVDTYTGSVIYATTDRSCTSTGIPALPSLAMKSPEDATKNVSEFLHEKYPQYDKRHIIYSYREMPDSYHKDIEYAFTGDNTNIDLSFDPAEGSLTHYAVYNSNLVGKCAGSPEIVFFAVAVMIFLYRQKR